MLSDTIAAIATPLGGMGGIGVVRISGEDALKVIKRIFKPSSGEEFVSHTLRHGWIVDNSSDIDEVMVSYMVSPKSYTGEDVVEISCHGGNAVIKQVLELAVKAGARLAQRGEFTKRAFLNGKIDLAQAEAVIDLIRAKTKETSLLAASQLKGSLSTRIGAIRDNLLGLLAEIDVSIDFPDEIQDVDHNKLGSEIKNAVRAVDNLLETADIGIIYREGLAVAIVGKPNVGKSSLLNALLRKERAIVAKEPGTTRDIIEEILNIRGIPVRVIDTAGIRRSIDNVEKLGIGRALNAIEQADLVLLVIDISENISSEDIELIKRTQEIKRIIVLNKSDLPHALKPNDTKRFITANTASVNVSALTGEGMENLEGVIFDIINSNKVVAQNIEVMINLRHKQCLIRARELLENCLKSINGRMQTDFISIDLKGAVAAIGEVTGEVVSDEVIDRIFEEFCVGK